MKIYILTAAIITLIACNNNISTQTSVANDTNAVSNKTDSTVVTVHPDSTHIDSAMNNLTSNNTIVAGENIGKVEIGMSDTSLEPLLGKPDLSNAAMGKAWLTWYGKKSDEHNNKTQLNVYTSYRDTSMRDKSVQQIRTTSSFFETLQDIHVYSSLDDIKKVFPGIKKVQQSANDAKKITVYDDANNGIAFEIVDANRQQICRAIFVHTKSKSVRDIYIDAPSNE
jgi:hypothetical protein